MNYLTNIDSYEYVRVAAGLAAETADWSVCDIPVPVPVYEHTDTTSLYSLVVSAGDSKNKNLSCYKMIQKLYDSSASGA